MATPSSQLIALLDHPVAAGIAAPLRRAMQQAASAPQAASGESDPPQVVESMLEALVLLGADGDTAAAAILHTYPGWQAAMGSIERDFATVAPLLEGQRAAAQVWALHAERHGQAGNEGLRRLLLAIVRDLRVVPILLARQLARMRHAEPLPDAERRELALLTRDIHAPLANRLGIWQLKWELEDLAFRYLEPQTYQQIARLLDEKRTDRERYIEQVKLTLREAMSAQGVVAEVAGRPKHIYSIWKKMQRKNVPIGELYDLRAVRVLVDSLADCYAALGVVHATWAPIPSEFDDYIARPKRNDYRSLHTAVVGPEGKTLEVQIRTHEMHRQAELGVAAHWKYKEVGSHSADAAFDRKIAWMRRLLEGSTEGGARGRFAQRRVRHRAGRGPHLRAHAQGRGDRPADRGDAAGLRLPRAYRGRASLPRRQDRWPHRPARPQAAQRRPGRDHDRQDRRTAPRLAGRGQWVPGQQPFARQGAGLVPQARPRPQRKRW